MAHRENNHLVATHHVLTGYQQPGAFFDKVASRDDWPSYSSALDNLRPRTDGVPSGVNLPTFLVEGPLTWPGQHAGFLGPRHDPWQVTRDPNAPGFKMDGMTLAPGLEISQLFRLVHDDVYKATDKKQEPFTYGQLSAQSLYFRVQ